MAPNDACRAEVRTTVDQEFEIVLVPLSHPELGEIRIDENLFAVGRTEPPFASYTPEIVADLSRRHARIFSEYGAVYIADLGSKNGTTVNGIDMRQKTSRLQDGDEISFGRALAYRVRLATRTQAAGRAAQLLSLTLTPEHGDLGLQPIVITQFPFLVSKADDTFSRYKADYPHQVNYLSRRHAHIFLKHGRPFVEDLGSTNGTFVEDKRLDEHAVPLDEGDVLAFGGHHFVYKVSLQMEEHEVDPTVTKLSSVMRNPAPTIVDGDKTTFVAAADSFLDIFCIDQAPPPDEEVSGDAKPGDDIGAAAGAGKARGKVRIFVSELADAFAGGERQISRRALWAGMSVLAVLGMAAVVIYWGGASRREMQDTLASGDYARAAVVANHYLERDPDNPEARAVGTEALLKANVPKWVALLKARDFDQADSIIAGMKKLGDHNADVLPLVNELEWIGNLEKFVMGRGGVDAPIRMYADEAKIKDLLARWDSDPQSHQRAFAAIASYVPDFKEPYAEALSHQRKLQNDASVYLAAIERLKTAIGEELNQNHPEALEPILKEYAEKYPRLGLDSVRQDLRQYTAVDADLRARRLGPLLAQAEKARFATPPFQARFRALTASSQFPPADVVQQYKAVAKAWQGGDTTRAVAGLQKIAAGPWADAAAKELERKKLIMDQFAALQKARGDKGYDDRLLAFYGTLDPGEDVYFIRATKEDIARYKDQALRHAGEQLTRAQAAWREYQQNGPIQSKERLEGAVSNQFRTQARLLSEAEDDARQGARIYTQLKTNYPEDWRKLQDQINAEAESQRNSLRELRNILEPRLLNEKLTLLGERSDEKRQSP